MLCAPRLNFMLSEILGTVRIIVPSRCHFDISLVAIGVC